MFRFTIRELVLLTLVVAMGVEWWVDRNRLAAESQHRLELLYELAHPSPGPRRLQSGRCSAYQQW
jgi:hypothetical protein